MTYGVLNSALSKENILVAARFAFSLDKLYVFNEWERDGWMSFTVPALYSTHRSATLMFQM